MPASQIEPRTEAPVISCPSFARTTLVAVALLAPAGLAAPAALAGQAGFAPNVKPTLAVSRAPGKIAIDGELGDPGWAGAARAANFAEIAPRDNVRPEVETEVLVTYDSEHLYVAFLAKDDP